MFGYWGSGAGQGAVARGCGSGWDRSRGPELGGRESGTEISGSGAGRAFGCIFYMFLLDLKIYMNMLMYIYIYVYIYIY